MLTVTETLEAWEDSVNIGAASRHRHMNICRCLHLFIFSDRLIAFMCAKACKLHGDHADICGYAVTTGAYKSRLLIFAAVYCSCHQLRSLCLALFNLHGGDGYLPATCHCHMHADLKCTYTYVIFMDVWDREAAVSLLTSL